MGEGEDERPENFDQILEMTGLDPEQVRKHSVNWLLKCKSNFPNPLTHMFHLSGRLPLMCPSCHFCIT